MMCPRSAVDVPSFNFPLLLKELVCIYNIERVQLGGIGGQFACSRTGACPEIILSIGWGVQA